MKHINSILTGAIIAILGFVIWPNFVNAASTFYYSQNVQGTSTQSIDRNVNCDVNQTGYHPYYNGVVSIEIDGDIFTGITSQQNINFIDLKLLSTNTNPNKEWRVHVASTTDIINQCNANSCLRTGNPIIATSTPFTSNDVYTDLDNADWFRIYFPEPFDINLNNDRNIWIYLETSSCADEAMDLQFNKTTYDTTAGITAYKLTTSSQTNVNDIDLRLGYEDNGGLSYMLLNSEVPHTSPQPLTFTVGFDGYIQQSDIELYQDGEWSLQFGVNVVYDDGTNDYIAYDISQNPDQGLNEFRGEATIDKSGRVTISPLKLVAATNTINALPDEIFYADNPNFYATDGTASTSLLFNITRRRMQRPGNLMYTQPASTSAATLMEACNPMLGGIDWSSNTWLSNEKFDVTTCLRMFLIPSEDDVNMIWDTASNTILAQIPFSWGRRVYEIYTKEASTTLPAIILTIPTGLPGSGKQLDLSPWEHIHDFWYKTPSGTFFNAGTTTTIWGMTEPIFNLIGGVLFLSFFVSRVIKFTP